jgi:hypothetical protein
MMLRQEDGEFKANLVYRARWRVVWAISGDLSKTKQTISNADFL